MNVLLMFLGFIELFMFTGVAFRLRENALKKSPNGTLKNQRCLIPIIDL
jgi:hypothetical protein